MDPVAALRNARFPDPDDQGAVTMETDRNSRLIV
jgi:hypothetical protein